MAIDRNSMVKWVNNTLKPENFKDSCPNGIQVFGKDRVERIATCVSVSDEFFQRAVEAEADLLLVHHGLFWEGASRVVDPWMARRLLVLLEKQINLVAYHLPLDAHPRLGNNARMAELLSLENLDFCFGHYKGTPIGCMGDLSKAKTLDEVVVGINDVLEGRPELFSFGKDRIERVGVVVGGAGDIALLQEAVAAGCDTYITGTVFEQSVAIAREMKINVVALGHYNSEKLGVRALGDALSRQFPIEVEHIDIPNPV